MKKFLIASTLVLIAAGPALAFDPQPDPPKTHTLAGDGSVRLGDGSVRMGDGSVRIGISR